MQTLRLRASAVVLENAGVTYVGAGEVCAERQVVGADSERGLESAVPGDSSCVGVYRDLTIGS